MCYVLLNILVALIHIYIYINIICCGVLYGEIRLNAAYIVFNNEIMQSCANCLPYLAGFLLFLLFPTFPTFLF